MVTDRHIFFCRAISPLILMVLTASLLPGCSKTVTLEPTAKKPPEQIKEQPKQTVSPNIKKEPQKAKKKTPPSLQPPHAANKKKPPPQAQAKTLYPAGRKISFTGETVTIEGVKYPVPKAWTGQGLEAHPLQKSELTRLPQKYSEGESNIYLLQEAGDAFVAMAKAAEKEDIHLVVNSGYRSAWYQRQIFIRRLEEGKNFEEIVKGVAPPGYSEHMLGTVVDFSPGNWRFASTPAYAWLRENAATYGFSESYPENNRLHPWESWHWRYRKPIGQN